MGVCEVKVLFVATNRARILAETSAHIGINQFIDDLPSSSFVNSKPPADLNEAETLKPKFDDLAIPLALR